MIKAEQTVVIDRPIEEVFAYVTDQTNTPNWQAGLVEAKRTTASPIGVGTKHTFVRNFMGRRMEADNEYVAYEPNRLVTFRTTSGPPLVASYLFDAVPDGTRLTSRVELQGAQPCHRVACVADTGQDDAGGAAQAGGVGRQLGRGAEPIERVAQ